MPGQGSILELGKPAGIEHFLGIDPGLSGGLVVLGRGQVIDIRPMPELEVDIWQWFSTWATPSAVAVIELVSGWQGGNRNTDGSEREGHKGQPASSMFKFGVSYGGLRMALIAAGMAEGVSWWAIRPKTWQRALGIGPSGRTPKERQAHKRIIKERAEELYPSARPTLKTADALLMATYCRDILSRTTNAGDR